VVAAPPRRRELILMRRLRMSWPWRRRRGGGVRVPRAVRTAQTVGADVEQLLLVLFFVLFTIGAIMAVVQMVQARSIY
jgi:hypothetical protein